MVRPTISVRSLIDTVLHYTDFTVWWQMYYSVFDVILKILICVLNLLWRSHEKEHSVRYGALTTLWDSECARSSGLLVRMTVGPSAGWTERER